VPNIGLVLSGGFAKGAYQVGVLNAVREYFNDGKVRYISASSVGVLNAYAFANDRMDVIERMWKNLKFTGLRSFAYAYMRGPEITNVIDDLACGFSAEQPYFYATYLNISKMKLNYINLKDVDPAKMKDYLLASISLPTLTRTVNISGTRYADGAMVDNIPVAPLMKHPLDYALVVHFDPNNYLFENSYFDSKLIKINFFDEKIIRGSLAFDKDSVSYMIKTGYEESMTIFDMLFKTGFDDIEAVYQKIKFLNDLRGKKSFRLTGDVVVSNMNKVLKKVIRSKI